MVQGPDPLAPPLSPSGDPEPPVRRPSRRIRWTRLLPLAILAMGFAAFFAFELDAYLSLTALSEHRQALLAWQDGNPILVVVAFMTAYALAVAFSVPGAVWLTIAGGFLFGLWLGTLYVVLAATIGACAIFLAARYAFADLLRAKAGDRLRRMEAGFRENTISYLLHLRLVPVYPFWLVNLAPAFFDVPLATYAACTFLGIIPGTAVFVAVGHGAGVTLDQGGELDLGIIFSAEILLPLIGLGLLSLVPVILKKWRARRSGVESYGTDGNPPR